MKKRFLILISLGVIVLGLIVVWIIWPNMRQFQARYLLNRAAEQSLPQLNDGEIVGILPEEFPSRVGNTCFFARDYFVLAFSSMSTEAAMEEYKKQLVILGWQKRGSIYINGDNLKLNVSENNLPVLDIHKVVDYEMLRNTYNGVLTIGIDYILPDRSTCNQ
jgi:hypothetical protein